MRSKSRITLSRQVGPFLSVALVCCGLSAAGEAATHYYTQYPAPEDTPAPNNDDMALADPAASDYRLLDSDAPYQRKRKESLRAAREDGDMPLMARGEEDYRHEASYKFNMQEGPHSPELPAVVAATAPVKQFALLSPAAMQPVVLAQAAPAPFAARFSCAAPAMAQAPQTMTVASEHPSSAAVAPHPAPAKLPQASELLAYVPEPVLREETSSLVPWVAASPLKAAQENTAPVTVKAASFALAAPAAQPAPPSVMLQKTEPLAVQEQTVATGDIAPDATGTDSRRFETYHISHHTATPYNTTLASGRTTSVLAEAVPATSSLLAAVPSETLAMLSPAAGTPGQPTIVASSQGDALPLPLPSSASDTQSGTKLTLPLPSNTVSAGVTATIVSPAAAPVTATPLSAPAPVVVPSNLPDLPGVKPAPPASPALITPPGGTPMPAQEAAQLPPIMSHGEQADISAQSKHIANTLPAAKVPASEAKKGPVDLEHLHKNALEEDTEVKEHNGVGVKISIRQPKADVSKMLESAYDALIAGNQEDAINLYKQVLETEPSNKLALFGLATTYHRAGQIDMARPLYGKLLEIDPQNVEGLNNFLVLLADESPAGALKELDQLERKHAQFSPIAAQKGIIYEKMGDYPKAAEAMAHAISLSPENLRYRYDMAIILDKQGSWEDAAMFYQQLLVANDRGEKIPANPEEIQERLTFIRSNRPGT